MTFLTSNNSNNTSAGSNQVPRPSNPIPSHNHNHGVFEVNDEVEDDVLLGAYLICHFHQMCENCGTSNTPQFRKGWYSEVLGRSVFLCNACGLKYHKRQYCSYCLFVYGKDDRVHEGFLVCSGCTRWIHESCERKSGTYFQNNNNAENTQHYQCPDCRSQSTVPKHLSQPILPAYTPAVNSNNNGIIAQPSKRATRESLKNMTQSSPASTNQTLPQHQQNAALLSHSPSKQPFFSGFPLPNQYPATSGFPMPSYLSANPMYAHLNPNSVPSSLPNSMPSSPSHSSTFPEMIVSQQSQNSSNANLMNGPASNASAFNFPAFKVEVLGDAMEISTSNTPTKMDFRQN